MEEPVFLIVEACSLNQHIMHIFRFTSPMVDAVKMNRFHQQKKKNCVKETNEKTVVDYFCLKEILEVSDFFVNISIIDLGKL